MVQFLSITMEKLIIKYHASNGFTLIELLLVLVIISVVLLIAVPPAMSAYHTIEIDMFIEILESDMLYSQSYSMESRINKRIIFEKESYMIFDSDNNDSKITRYYPSNLKLVNVTNYVLNFSKTGTLNNPRTLNLHSDSKRIKIVLPLGKGRFYVEKQ